MSQFGLDLFEKFISSLTAIQIFPSTCVLRPWGFAWRNPLKKAAVLLSITMMLFACVAIGAENTKPRGSHGSGKNCITFTTLAKRKGVKPQSLFR